MTTNAERQAEYKERMRKAGFQQVTLWIQPERKDGLVEIAKDIRESPAPITLHFAPMFIEK